MRLLVVLPRFGPQVTGGAESWFANVLHELVARGHEATVLTARATRIEVGPGSLVDWTGGEDLPEREDWEGVRIERFPVDAPSPLSRVLAHALAAFEARRALDSRVLGSRLFPDGWWGPEALDDGVGSVLWSPGESTLRLPPSCGALCLEVVAPHAGVLEWSTPGRAARRRQLAGGRQTIRIEAAADDEVRLRFRGRAMRSGGRRAAFGLREVRAWDRGAPRLLFGPRAAENGEAATQVRALLRWGARRHALDEFASRRYRGPRSRALVSRAAALADGVDAVVAGHFPFTLPSDAQAVARGAGKPFVLVPFAHAHDPGHHYRWLYGLLRSADRVVALSRFNAAAFFAPLGARPILVGGGPTHRCQPAPEAEVAAFRASLGIPADHVVVLTVARKTAYKGYRAVLEAVEETRRRGHRVLHLWVGPDEDGRTVLSPAWRYARLLPGDRLCLAYRASDVFCLFSEHESFGMVLLDAWRHGLPVVVHRRCGPSAEMVADGVSGLHADGSDLADVLGRLASAPDLRRALGEGGASALAAHAWDVAADRLEGALEGLVSRGSARP